LSVEFDVFFGIAPRRENRLCDGDNLQVIVQGQSVDEGVFGPLADLETRKERCFLTNRTAHLALQAETLPCRFHGGEWIASVENVASVVGLDFAMKIVAAGFGEYLDAAHTDAVVLRGEGILVDADFADRGFGGQAPAGKSVDINLAAVRPGAGAGESSEISRQIVGIVGEGIEVRAAHHERVSIGRRIDFHPDGLTGIADGYALLGRVERHREVECLRDSRTHRNIPPLGEGEAFSRDAHSVSAGGQVR